MLVRGLSHMSVRGMNCKLWDDGLSDGCCHRLSRGKRKLVLFVFFYQLVQSWCWPFRVLWWDFMLIRWQALNRVFFLLFHLNFGFFLFLLVHHQLRQELINSHISELAVVLQVRQINDIWLLLVRVLWVCLITLLSHNVNRVHQKLM